MAENKKYKKGNIIKGVVSGITNYGIFIKIDENYSGLIHISEISDRYVNDPKQFAEVNDIINVEILEVNEYDSQMKLSIKNIEYRNTIPKRKKKIIETKQGFNTLAYKLPFWIDENLKNSKKWVKII